MTRYDDWSNSFFDGESSSYIKNSSASKTRYQKKPYNRTKSDAYINNIPTRNTISFTSHYMN